MVEKFSLILAKASWNFSRETVSISRMVLRRFSMAS